MLPCRPAKSSRMTSPWPSPTPSMLSCWLCGLGTREPSASSVTKLQSGRYCTLCVQVWNAHTAAFVHLSCSCCSKKVTCLTLRQNCRDDLCIVHVNTVWYTNVCTILHTPNGDFVYMMPWSSLHHAYVMSMSSEDVCLSIFCLCEVELIIGLALRLMQNGSRAWCACMTSAHGLGRSRQPSATWNAHNLDSSDVMFYTCNMTRCACCTARRHPGRIYKAAWDSAWGKHLLMGLPRPVCELQRWELNTLGNRSYQCRPVLWGRLWNHSTCYHMGAVWTSSWAQPSGVLADELCWICFCAFVVL